MKKDTYEIIYNPANLLFKYEVWINGDVHSVVYDDLNIPSVVFKNVTKCVGAYLTVNQAQARIDYQESLNKFKEKAGQWKLGYNNG